ncbi:2-hydroxychromene-2-carboxylate isomerase [Piscinibacter sakaiensis]|uniref:2-hydroxychromene-2-carboxylate isomerase n=1 Tax=Piscinibacter sakaiensis TaxID=1547922 RepID=UPI003AADEF3C
MKQLDFWFDPISPYAWLAFERLPQALEGLSYSIDYRPLLFAGLLQNWGQKGPAEIEPKRAWTFRQVAWLGHLQGTPIDTPAQHPFNPLALLRLLLASAPEGRTPNRQQCEQVLRHVWIGGADANDPDRLAALQAELRPPRDPASDDVKQQLKTHTAQALQLGIFGVPTIAVDGRLFWGLDALPMVAACLRGDPWFDGPAWDEAGAPRPGVRRA